MTRTKSGGRRRIGDRARRRTGRFRIRRRIRITQPTMDTAITTNPLYPVVGSRRRGRRHRGRDRDAAVCGRSARPSRRRRPITRAALRPAAELLPAARQCRVPVTARRTGVYRTAASTTVAARAVVCASAAGVVFVLHAPDDARVIRQYGEFDDYRGSPPARANGGYYRQDGRVRNGGYYAPPQRPYGAPECRLLLTARPISTESIRARAFVSRA